MRSFGGYCRIASAFGDISLRYVHNVRETFRNARFGRFRDVLGGGVLPHGPIGMRRIARHPQLANARILSMQAMFDWRLTQALHWKL